MIELVLGIELENDFVLRKVYEVAQKIKNLEIRGATTIAIKALETVIFVAEKAPRETFDELLEKSIKVLINSRPTEPAMFNGLCYVLGEFRASGDESVDLKKRVVVETARDFLDKLFKAFNKIIEIGARLIPDDSTIMTHCHSSTVVNILKKAFESGKRFKVITSETRPLYQGRRTARELAQAGIEVLHVVDSAMRWVARKYKPDIAIIGADAITSLGVVINKIGSKLLALVAKEFDFPLYVATTLLKLDPRTLAGEYVEIEMRDPGEVWGEAPENVLVLNPAFETVSPEYIDGLITEAGVIPPNQAIVEFEKYYPKIWRYRNSELI